MLDLDKAQRSRAGSVRGNVVNDWAVMAVGPGIPLQSDGGSRSDGDIRGAGRGALVACDVLTSGLDRLFTVVSLSLLTYGGTIGIWGDEAVVLVQGVPTSGGWLRGEVVPVGVATWVPLAASNDARHISVSRDCWESSQSREGHSWNREGVHLQHAWSRLAVMGCLIRTLGLGAKEDETRSTVSEVK